LGDQQRFLEKIRKLETFLGRPLTVREIERLRESNASEPEQLDSESSSTVEWVRIRKKSSA